MRKRWEMVAIIGMLILFQACTSAKPREDRDISTMETRLAELNQRIDELNHRVSVLQFMVDDHQKSIKALGKPAPEVLPKTGTPVGKSTALNPARGTSASVAPPVQPPLPSESAEAAYQHARFEYKSKHFKKAASRFTSIAANYPGHDLADNALYWAGECFYSLKDYSGAISAFKKVIKYYPNGSKAPDSLLKIGYSYLALKDPANARSFLKKVVTQYPFTPAGAKAGEMLKKIKTR